MGGRAGRWQGPWERGHLRAVPGPQEGSRAARRGARRRKVDGPGTPQRASSAAPGRERAPAAARGAGQPVSGPAAPLQAGDCPCRACPLSAPPQAFPEGCPAGGAERRRARTRCGKGAGPHRTRLRGRRFSPWRVDGLLLLRDPGRRRAVSSWGRLRVCRVGAEGEAGRAPRVSEQIRVIAATPLTYC